LAARAVGKFGRGDDEPLIAGAHELDDLIPALNHLAAPESEFEGLFWVESLVKGVAVNEAANVEHGHHLPALSEGAFAFLKHDVADAGIGDFGIREVLLDPLKVFGRELLALRMEGQRSEGGKQCKEEKRYDAA